MSRCNHLRVVPLTLAEANAFILRHHRHHGKVQGHRFSIGAMRIDAACNVLVGVCVVGRPVARKTDQYMVAEVTRLCTDGTPHACSLLYAAAARAARAMGFESIQTFILAEEPGTSLRAAGWVPVSDTPGTSWTRPSRERVDVEPATLFGPGRVLHHGPRVLWEKRLNA